MQLALDAEKSSADAAAVRHDRERRTRRINEMLCYRIYKRNQILPLKQQALGTSYNASSDSMNIAVRMDNCCLTVFAPYLIRLNVRTCKKIPSFLKIFENIFAPLSLCFGSCPGHHGQIPAQNGDHGSYGRRKEGSKCFWREISCQ